MLGECNGNFRSEVLSRELKKGKELHRGHGGKGTENTEEERLEE
jgi:hypothetical protein